MARARTTFGSDFRRFFGRGLAVLLPSILTLWILWAAFGFVFNKVAAPINRGIRWAVVEVVPLTVPPQRLPAWFSVTDTELQQFRGANPDVVRRGLTDSQLRLEVRRRNFADYWNRHWYLQGTGLLVAIMLIYLAGLLLGGLLGRSLYERVEGLIARIPGFKQVYPHVKQLVNLIIGDKPMAFKRVVLVEYPRKGIWTLGLVTSSSLRTVAEQTEGGALAIFIPSTPTPFTGFTISVAEREVVDVPLTVDEALRFVLTGGVLIPERQAMGLSEGTVADLNRRVEAGAAIQRGG